MLSMRNWKHPLPPATQSRIRDECEALTNSPRIIIFTPTSPPPGARNDPTIAIIHRWFNALSPVETVSPLPPSPEESINPPITKWEIVFWDPTFPIQLLGEFTPPPPPPPSSSAPHYFNFHTPGAPSATLEIDGSQRGTITWSPYPLKTMLHSLLSVYKHHDPSFTCHYNLLKHNSLLDLSPNSPSRAQVLSVHAGLAAERKSQIEAQGMADLDYFHVHQPLFTQQAGIWHVGFFDWETALVVLYTLTQREVVDAYMHASNRFGGRVAVVGQRVRGGKVEVDMGVRDQRRERSGWEDLIA